MEVKFNVTGEERKSLVVAIAAILECRPRYLGMPSMAYEVGDIVVGKDGCISFDDQVEKEKVEALLKALEKEGFISEAPVAENEMLETTVDSLVVEMSIELFTEDSFDNLEKLVEVKADLIKKALATDSLPIEKAEERIRFPWFHGEQDSNTVKAYTHFVTAICEMARNQKRISSKKKEVENEKYAFRCFLLRLGFIGEEYKEERKILLQNFSGSSAFKGGTKNEVSK
ncbi:MULTISPECIES: virulence protein [Clostridium]|uniref:Virulence-like protein n=2 Tax=Clostridium TaxID=1485 RepID=A0A381JBF2_9CLOT|nr:MULTISPECIES: virulence protein [Clostridium]PPK44977.1 hypothetical protein BD821_12123 [Clostridium algidicarnis DSM 15099]SUY47712.1 virulence-like protein [Clostridium putrefaciens]